ncbi:MAG: hypothetical protein HZB16_00505, partial [Armatimonadetes bacterium]|nr:hypothetical protein [Armatimonadota bacterium]
KLAALCSSEAITAPVPAIAAQPVTRAVTQADLVGLREARLKLDIFGSDSGQYDNKWLELNGQRVAKVPTNNADSWSSGVVALKPEQLAWVTQRNELRIVSAAADAWKLRGATLAVRLAGGDWVRTPADPTVWSSPNWAFSEGKPFTGEQGGVAGPMALDFGEGCEVLRAAVAEAEVWPRVWRARTQTLW